MLATATEPYFYPNHATQPLEVHRSKISLTRARAGYDYPTIHLPFAFSRLIGLSTRIYQTVHDGALAFLVVVLPGSTARESSPHLCEKTEAPRLYTAKIKRSNRLEPIVSFYNQKRSIAKKYELRIWVTTRQRRKYNSTL
jgi:hypothetical protein